MLNRGRVVLPASQPVCVWAATSGADWSGARRIRRRHKCPWWPPLYNRQPTATRWPCQVGGNAPSWPEDCPRKGSRGGMGRPALCPPVLKHGPNTASRRTGVNARGEGRGNTWGTIASCLARWKRTPPRHVGNVPYRGTLETCPTEACWKRALRAVTVGLDRKPGRPRVAKNRR